MIKFIFTLLLIPVCVFSQSNRKKISTLFLGNSYTYVNNLPLLIYNIALANGDTLVYDGNLIGGYSFNNHFNDVNSKAKINLKPWDYVVLQAQSQEPSFPPSQVSSQTTPYALKLDSLIKTNYSCSNTVFYETWGRKNGDAANCGFYPPLCTYTGMQNRLKESYKLFADLTNGVMAPAGEAFRASISADPSLELYDPDQSHPSLSGSYLAASVFYELLFQKSVVSNTYNPGISAPTLAFLQQTAHTTFNDSLNRWNVGINLPWANFTISSASATGFQFQSPNVNSSNTWYFGDGGTSQALSPTHQYNAAGSYTVSHVVSDGCKKDSVSKVVTVIATGIAQQSSNDSKLVLYPNPGTDLLYLQGADNFKNSGAIIEIKNTLGQTVYSSEFKESISIAGFNNGLYLLKICTDTSVVNAYFVKQ